MQYRNIFSASRPKLMSPPKGLMTFPLKFRKIVAAKMRQSGRPAEHYSKTTGMLKKMYRK